MPTDSAELWRLGARDAQCGSKCGSGTMGPLAAQVRAASVTAHAKQMPVCLFIKANTLFGFSLVWRKQILMSVFCHMKWRDMDFQRAGSPVCVLLEVKPYLVFLHMLIAPLAC